MSDAEIGCAQRAARDWLKSHPRGAGTAGDPRGRVRTQAPAKSSSSALATCASTLGQSPAEGWRNRRVCGYQGLCSPDSVQRQSGENGSSTQNAAPKRAGEMDDRGVDRNRQIGKRNHRGGVGHVVELFADMGDAWLAASRAASSSRRSR